MIAVNRERHDQQPMGPTPRRPPPPPCVHCGAATSSPVGRGELLTTRNGQLVVNSVSLMRSRMVRGPGTSHTGWVAVHAATTRPWTGLWARSRNRGSSTPPNTTYRILVAGDVLYNGGTPSSPAVGVATNIGYLRSSLGATSYPATVTLPTGQTTPTATAQVRGFEVGDTYKTAARCAVIACVRPRVGSPDGGSHLRVDDAGFTSAPTATSLTFSTPQRSRRGARASRQSVDRRHTGDDPESAWARQGRRNIRFAGRAKPQTRNFVTRDGAARWVEASYPGIVSEWADATVLEPFGPATVPRRRPCLQLGVE